MSNLPKQLLLVFAFPLVYFLTVFPVIFFSATYLATHQKLAKTIEDKMVKTPVYRLFSKVPPVLGAYTSSINSSDARPVIVEQFFASHHSPLASYGKVFVEAADKYGLPWELLPAISMQESNGGKRIPSEECLNPFGWGIHSKGTLCFDSWELAIDKVAAGLKKYYVDQGLTTVTQIMSKYNPTSFNRDGSWGNGVSYFVQEIQEFNTLQSR